MQRPVATGYPARYYYMGVLSCLLVHYALDAFLFSVSNRRSADVTNDPYAVPAVI